MSRTLVMILAQLAIALLTVIPNLTHAQVKNRISIATGGTGGVYYPLGGGMAALISKNIPNTEATAEVTTASVDNVKLLHGNPRRLGFFAA
ncbi:MAG: TAXI family TRAP transporter solute-binding subunit [Candidatus Binatia bacterium]